MPLINPYIIGDPVGNSPIFVGRENITREVLKVLSDPNLNAITLYGQRRVGKTSMLQFLQVRLPMEGKFQTVYFDLQDKSEWPLPRILLALANTIADRLNPPVPIPSITEDTFTKWLASALVSLPPDTSMVLLFDEFDVLADYNSSNATTDFFLYLGKLLIFDPARLKFVLVLGRNFTDLGTAALSAFKGIPSRRISLLNKADTLKLVRLSEQGKKTLDWPARAAEMVWSLTHGHPYLTQALCSQVWLTAYDEAPKHAPEVTPEMVEAAVDATLDTSRNTLEWLWTGLGPAEKVISAALSGAGNEVVDELHLAQILRDSGVRILIRELQNAPELLKSWDILEPVSGGYVFRVEILRRWIERYHSLKRTQDELDRIQPAADSLYQAAQAFYAQGKLNEPEELLKQAIGVNPNHLQANELLAEILIGLGRLDEARDLLERLFELVPNNARPRLIQVCLDQAHVAPDDRTRLKLYERVLELDSSRPEAIAGLEKIRQAEQDEHELASHFLNGRQALQRGEWDQAIELLQKVVASRPSYFYESDTAADLLAHAVHEKEHPSSLWRIWLRRTQTWYIFGGILVIFIGFFILGIGQSIVSLGVQGIGPLNGLAPSTPTATLTVTPLISPTNTAILEPTSTETPIPTSTLTPILPGAIQIRPDDGAAMIYVPAGTFTMGSEQGWQDEKPAHTVQLNAFWMDKTEVTNEMYIKFLNAKRSELSFQFGEQEVVDGKTRIYYLLKDGSNWDRIGWNKDNKEFLLKYAIYANHPVVNVTWYGATEYCQWAGSRLPTEAEWEYAARGLDERTYPWDNTPPEITLANYNTLVGSTTAVGSYPNGASPFGILDMAGNVWEWVNDWYGTNYYQRPVFLNPAGPDNGMYRILRGGSWKSPADNVLTWNRYDLLPVNYGNLYGFRCVVSQ